jgi:hypothetical protein
MLLDRYGVEATPGATSACPVCDGVLRAKCGRIIQHHWAHIAADCDPWSEPESEWHLAWKRHLRDARGADLEVVMKPHRADAVMPGGEVIELQSNYLGVEDIAAREQFYGHMRWLYRCTWHDRLQFGRKGFWWKHGSKGMTTHRRPVWWDMGNALWRVSLAAVPSEYGHRVVGKVLEVNLNGITTAGCDAGVVVADKLARSRATADCPQCTWPTKPYRLTPRPAYSCWICNKEWEVAA